MVVNGKDGRWRAPSSHWNTVYEILANSGDPNLLTVQNVYLSP